jgi:PilZ domain
MGHRQEPRVELNSIATLCGVDAQGRSFLENGIIRNISGRGILLEVPQCAAEVGDTVVLRCGTNRGRFEVMWISSDQNGSSQIGLEHVLPTSLFWGLDLPLPAPDPYYRARQKSRRQSCRFTTELSVEVRVNGKVPIWSSTANVSDGGCFVHMLNSLPLFTRVDIALWLGEAKFWTEGIVVSSVNGAGIGIKFLRISAEARERLRNAAESSAEIQDRRVPSEQYFATDEMESELNSEYSAIAEV